MSATSASSMSTTASLVEVKEKILAALPEVLENAGMKGTTNLAYLSKGVYNIVYSFDWQKSDDETVPCIVRINNLQPHDEDDDYSSDEDESDQDEDDRSSKGPNDEGETDMVDSIGPAESENPEKTSDENDSVCVTHDHLDASAQFEKELEVACCETLNAAAVLKYVHSRLPNTPELLFVDGTTRNPLGRPFTIQTRLKGGSLKDIWYDLELEDKLQITEQLAGVFVQMDAVRFPRLGNLGVVAKDGFDLELGIYDLAADVADSQQPIDSLTEEYISFRDWCTASYRGETNGGCYHTQIYVNDEFVEARKAAWAGVGTVLEQSTAAPQLQQLWSANAHNARLTHVDLHMGNILAWRKENPDGGFTWEIGIIDWDGAQACPPALAHAPPTFLWEGRMFSDFNFFTAWAGDPTIITREAREYPESPNGKEIREHFEKCLADKLTREQGEAAAKEWLDHINGDGIWMRRIGELCLGIGEEGGRLQAAEELVEDWADYQAITLGQKLPLPESPKLEATQCVPLKRKLDELYPTLEEDLESLPLLASYDPALMPSPTLTAVDPQRLQSSKYKHGPAPIVIREVDFGYFPRTSQAAPETPLALEEGLIDADTDKRLSLCQKIGKVVRATWRALTRGVVPMRRR